jgi:hypothetical protein
MLYPLYYFYVDNQAGPKSVTQFNNSVQAQCLGHSKIRLLLLSLCISLVLRSNNPRMLLSIFHTISYLRGVHT